MTLGALLFTSCLLQTRFISLTASTPSQGTPVSSCPRANYEHERGGDGCKFSVSWRREDEGQLVTIEVAALVPDLGEDRWTAVLSLENDEVKGVFVCQWRDREWYQNCSLTRDSGAEEQVGCLNVNTTYHKPLLKCSFILPVTDGWSKLVSHPVSLHITSTCSVSEGSACEASSNCPCDISDCQDTCDGCAAVTSDKCHSTFSLFLIRSHAVLMVVTFLLLLPTGSTIARYSRSAFPHSWFRAHAVTNTAALSLTLLGLAAVLGHTGGSFKVGVHQVVGIVCISLVLFQALCGFLRPTAGISLQRRIFSVIHRALGGVILALGTWTMLLGAIMYKNSVYITVVVVLVAAILVEVVFLITLEVLLRMKRVVTPPVGYHRVKGKGDDDVEKENDSESEGELVVKEGGREGGENQPKTAEPDKNPSKPMEMYINTKRVLAVFVVQAFLFSAVIGVLLLYGEH